MSQLWNTFNTMQILLVMPLFSGLYLTSNVVFVQEIVDQIVNFKILDKEALQDSFLASMFSEADEEQEANENDSAVAEYFKGSSSLMQVFQIIVGVLVIGLLIILLVFCDRKVLPKCCPCFRKLIDFVKSRIMFNSLLRALLQTFLLTCISMWYAF